MAESKTRGRAGTYINGGAKMRNKIRLMSCVIMGMFLLLQTSSFAQGPGHLMSGTKEETSDEQKRDSSKEARYQPKIKGYTYNLKQLLQQAEENIEKVDEKIKEAEVRKRNKEREAKVREYFEKGNTFYQEEKLEEAKKEWQRALEVSKDSEMRNYIKESEKRLREKQRRQRIAKEKAEKEAQRKRAEAKRKQREKINSLYRQGKTAYSEENFGQAESFFKQILEIDPEYSGAQTYLNTYIPNKKQQLKEQVQKEKERRQREKQAELEKQKREKELARQRELREKVDSLYSQAIDYYRADQLNQAKQAFKEILALDPEGRKARAVTVYLETKIPNKTEQFELEKQREKINSLYRQGKTFYAKRQLDKAKNAFGKVLEIDPVHRGAKIYLETKIPYLIEQIKQ